MKRIWTLLVCGCLLASSAFAATFPDAEAHWAASALRVAVEKGILQGTDAGLLLPDESLTGAQAVTILVRLLGVETETPEEGEAWYAPAARAAEELGIRTDGWNLAEDLTRAQAFVLVANAFQLQTADTAALSVFADVDGMEQTARMCAAGLVQIGAVEGNDGMLRPEDAITRAEFVSLLDRMTGFGEPDSSPLLQMTSEKSVSLRGETMNGGLVLGPETNAVSLQNLQTSGPVVVRSAPLNSCRLENLVAPRLVLAQQEGAVSVSSGEFDSIQIGVGTGEVTLSGQLTERVEVFGSGREVRVQAATLSNLVVAGSDNTIYLNSQCEIGQLTILPGAERNTILVNGTLETALVRGSGTTLTGNGSAELIQVAAADCELELEATETEIDAGLDGVTVEVSAPTVSAGGMIQGTADIHGVSQEKTCRAQWYLDGVAVADATVSALALSEDTTVTCEIPLEFTEDMATEYRLTLMLEYDNPVRGETETVSGETLVTVENYSAEYYREQRRSQWESLVAQVSPDYVGDFTMEYDIDYTTEVKEAFVNYNGYSSKTEYLLWVNRATQKVNIFSGSQENWTLLATHRCATGAMSTPTPLGVTYVTYKQTGWYMGSYNVYWITRFYPNTGYAFHSRGYYPNSDVAMMPEIGYPMSAGCVRLYDDAAIWIYDNIPLNTTVVIY
jgi:hypothetical protein